MKKPLRPTRQESLSSDTPVCLQTTPGPADSSAASR
jgi:hypothetical protein